MSEDTTETTVQKIARLTAEKAKRAEAYAEADAEAKLAGLELEERFTKELGRAGVAFAMVDATEQEEGFIVVKPGTDLSFRAYIDAVTTAEGAPDAATIHAFVAPCVVHPSPEAFADLSRRKGFLGFRCAEALSSLHGTRKKRLEGKY